ncbi:DUF1800 domain-containing protein [Lysobacter brunescens]|uniref:DUF1800 family protein n=1 Tax=Lysobacter brunescens TaxID=262323 RepID=A0ABW2YF90_9GAMM
MATHATLQTAALNRFGLGAMPGDRDRVLDARDWLRAQLRPVPPPRMFDGLPGSVALLRRQTAYRLARRAERNDDSPASNDAGDDTPPGAMQQALRRDAMDDIAARYRHAAITDRPFVERLVHFWSNHFAISIDKNSARLLAAPMEREAIRPHVLGNFRDLLLAVETHPGMLLYLDNAASVGEESMLVRRQQRRAARRGDTDGTPRRLGLNENLAREILELHTLGVDGGYAQQDVVELARAITGWGTPLPREWDSATSAYVFRPGAHEPGARTVLGRRYAEDGEAQGRAILRDLALHPATARHLAFKLAWHMVADAPPPALVERMAAAYLRSGGELGALYAAMIDDDAAWSGEARKFKTPQDFLVSALRAGGVALERRPQALVRLLQGLGQPAFMPRSPAGFPDTADDWASGDSLRKRVQAAGLLADHVSDARAPQAIALDALGADAVAGLLGDSLRRAGSPREAIALLFSSPAFQWRV